MLHKYCTSLMGKTAKIKGAKQKYDISSRIKLLNYRWCVFFFICLLAAFGSNCTFKVNPVKLH